MPDFPAAVVTPCTGTSPARLAARRAGRGTVAVTAAGGRTGGRVARLLERAGVATRHLSRSYPYRFDWDNPSTWTGALAGARAAYLAYAPDLAAPGAADRLRHLTSVAVAEGVECLVLLSGGGGAARVGERAVQESGARWTVLRASRLMQNFSESRIAHSVRDGVLMLPAGSVREPFVDADDVAELAVAALTQDGHAGRVYELTGPELLTVGDAVAHIARATGRDLRVTEPPVSSRLTALEKQGVPPDLARLQGSLLGQHPAGRATRLADGVQEGLGRPPRSFADYAERTAATGVWDPSVTVAALDRAGMPTGRAEPPSPSAVLAEP